MATLIKQLAKLDYQNKSRVSLVLSERPLHEGQNHLLCDDNISGFRNWLVEVWMSAGTGRVKISSFFWRTGAKQVIQNTNFFLLEINWLAARDTPLSSSKTTSNICATSCLVLKSRGAPLKIENYHFEIHKKLR